MKGSCNLASVNYSTLPFSEKAYVTNTDTVISCGQSFPLDFDKNVTLIFSIPKTPQLLDPLQLALKLRVQVTEMDGTLLKTDEKIAIICELPFTGFSRVHISSNGSTVVDYSYYAYIAHIVQMCEYQADYINSVLKGEAAFAVDTAPCNNETFVANEGPPYRRTLVQRSHVCQMVTRPFQPPFLHEKLLPTACNWNIELTLNSSDFCLVYDPAKKFKLRLLNAQLVVNSVQVHQNVLDSIERQIRDDSLAGGLGLEVPFLDYKAVNLSIQLSQTEYTSASMTVPYPRRIFMVLIAEDNFQGKKEVTPLFYENCELGKVELTVNSKKMEVNTNFNDDEWTEGYHQLVRGLGIMNRGLILDSVNWATAQTIYCWDCTTAHLATCTDIISLPSETATVSVHLEFLQKLSKNYQCLLIFERDALMFIDKNYNVTVT